ncbi:hypothetical protein C5L14_05650 [Labrys okinawensis]|uniref:PepSY domain-containing protein n=1 Tax=Labrys okinawensis TaxID=346911 RepID=A0A2S9QH74_9HYPH|nr:hypothetical protein [Labrys okinawensis]PRH88709.1 hypothetical protein C5L14_05650 [Labrys okinawensis]
MPCRTLFGVIAGLAFLTLGLQTDVNAAFAQNSLNNYAQTPQQAPMLGNDRSLPLAPEEVGQGPDEAGNPRLLPPRAIVSSLAGRGYRNVVIKRVRGDSYIAEAEGSEGGRVLIVIDGHTTEITGLRQLGWARPPRQWDNDSWVPPRPWSGPRW